MASDVASIKRLLLGKRKLDVPSDWLEACVAWVKDENEGRNMSPAQYEQSVWEQWLVSDLRELSHGCLPVDIVQQQKVELKTGFFSLQVESVVDVSQSFYGQLQKVRGTENENVNVTATQPSWEPKAGRMLMLKMTDGIQDILGMEYQPIRCLNANLTPGTKVQIKAPVLCRRGVMMLRENNVSILGGDVEALVETNTPDAVLENHLQSNTNMSDTQWQQQKKQFSPKKQNSSRATGSRSARDTTTVDRTSSARDTNIVSRGNDQSNNHNVSLEPIPPEFEDSSMDIPDNDLMEHIEFEDHWDQDDVDIEEMMDSAVADVELRSLPESAFTQPSDTSRNTSRQPSNASVTTVSQPSNMLRNSAQQRNSSTSQINQSSVPSSNTISAYNVIGNRDSTNNNSNLVGQSRNSGNNQFDTSTDRSSASHQMLDSFVTKTSQSESRNVLREIDVEPVVPRVQQARPVIVDMFTQPFTYLSVLNQQFREDGPVKVKVKGYVATMLGRLNNNDGAHWSLTVKINDGTAAVDVDISDKVLTQLIGFSAADSLKLREQGKTDKNAKRKLREGVAKCQQGLIDMSCIMELEVRANSPVHSLRQLFPLNSSHVAQLQERNK